MDLQKGDFIELEFTGKTKDGEVFDSNIKSDIENAQLQQVAKPFIYAIDEGMFLKGIDEFLIGKDVGEYDLELTPEKVTLYPKKNPRMVWLMFANNYEAYRHLVHHVSKCLKNTVNLKQTRQKIIPHVTLGRIKSKIKIKDRKKIEQHLSLKQKIIFKQIILYHSQLTAHGSTYEALCKFPLREKTKAVNN